MNVFCILKTESGNTSLEFVFETFSRAYATLDRLRKQATVEKNIITYKVQEMYVYKGKEEVKNVSKYKEN